jgi:hypothetical protein
MNGDFQFKPTLDQVGRYTLTFSVTDGNLEDSETVTLEVPATNPLDDTVLEGRILNANDADVDGDTLNVNNFTQARNSMAIINPDKPGHFVCTGQ